MFHVGECPDKGRGLFANRLIMKGEVIERAPVVVLDAQDEMFVNRTNLYNYTFTWGPEGKAAIVLGYASLINHSYEPNAVYETELDTRMFACRALRDISPGEEILVNYNRDPQDRSPLWFTPVESEGHKKPAFAFAVSGGGVV